MMNNGPAMPYIMNMNGPIDPQQPVPMKPPPYSKALVVRTDMLNQLAQQRNEIESIESWHANFIATNGTMPPKQSRKRRLSNTAPSPMYPNPGMPGSIGAPQNNGMTPSSGMPQSSGIPSEFNQMPPQNSSSMNDFYQPMSNHGLPPQQMSMDIQQQLQQQQMQQHQLQQQQQHQQMQQHQLQQQHQQAMMANGCMPPQMQQSMNGGQYGNKMEIKKDEDDHPLRRIERMTEQTLEQSPKVNQRSNDKKQNEDRQQKMAKLDDIANALNLPNGAPIIPNMRPPYMPPGPIPQGFDPSQMMRPPNMMMQPGMDPNTMPPQMFNGMPTASMPQPSPNFPMMVNSPAHSQNGMMPGQYHNMPAGMSPKFPPMMPNAMMSPQAMRPPMMPPQYNGTNPEMMGSMRPPMPPPMGPGNQMHPDMWRQHILMQQQMQAAQMSHQQ